MIILDQPFEVVARLKLMVQDIPEPFFCWNRKISLLVHVCIQRIHTCHINIFNSSKTSSETRPSVNKMRHRYNVLTCTYFEACWCLYTVFLQLCTLESNLSGRKKRINIERCFECCTDNFCNFGGCTKGWLWKAARKVGHDYLL